MCYCLLTVCSRVCRSMLLLFLHIHADLPNRNLISVSGKTQNPLPLFGNCLESSRKFPPLQPCTVVFETTLQGKKSRVHICVCKMFIHPWYQKVNNIQLIPDAALEEINNNIFWCFSWRCSFLLDTWSWLGAICYNTWTKSIARGPFVYL